MKSRRTRKPLPLFIWVALAIWVVGCADRPDRTNSDANLRKTSTQFAAEAVKLHPFPTTAPSGGDAVARAEISYGHGVLSVANLSDTDWEPSPLWVNKTYVVLLPVVPKGTLKSVDFQMLFDDAGNSLPISHVKSPIKSVELLQNGKLYNITAKLED